MKAQFTVERTRLKLNTIPPMQDVVIVRNRGYQVALMGRWTTLCLEDGAVNALKATNEQILRAYITDESVFA
jgi:hypothetical protein